MQSFLNTQNAFSYLHSFIHCTNIGQLCHLILEIQSVRQGTYYHSCFTYKETKAQEGKLFTQSCIIPGRTGTWIKFSWLPVPGVPEVILHLFECFLHHENCPDLVNDKAQAVLFCFFAGLSIVNSDDEKHRCKFSSSELLHFCP